MEFTVVVARAYLPGRSPFNFGVLVVDEDSDRMYLRFRTDLEGMADDLDLEVIQGLPEMLGSMASDMGAVGVLSYLEDIASNAIQFERRANISAESAAQALERAFNSREGIV